MVATPRRTKRETHQRLFRLLSCSALTATRPVAARSCLEWCRRTGRRQAQCFPCSSRGETLPCAAPSGYEPAQRDTQARKPLQWSSQQLMLRPNPATLEGGHSIGVIFMLPLPGSTREQPQCQVDARQRLFEITNAGRSAYRTNGGTRVRRHVHGLTEHGVLDERRLFASPAPISSPCVALDTPRQKRVEARPRRQPRVSSSGRAS